jgi:hypothetical protein
VLRYSIQRLKKFILPQTSDQPLFFLKDGHYI